MSRARSERAVIQLLASNPGVIAAVGSENGVPCVGTQLPPGGTLPAVTVRRVGGPAGGLAEQRGDRSDWPTFQVDVFAGTLADGRTPDRTAAHNLKDAVLDAFDSTPATVSGGERIILQNLIAVRELDGDPVPRARIVIEAQFLVWASAA